jgi:hypothetical protein
MSKTAYGMKKPKSVPSPTGRPSPKSEDVKKMEAGDYSGGARPKSPEQVAQGRKEVKKSLIKKLKHRSSDYLRDIRQ